MKITGNKYWDGFHEKYGKMLNHAFGLAAEQRETKRSFDTKEVSIFDRSLTDIRRFKEFGKWITSFHCAMRNKIISGQQACPAFDISYKIILQQDKNREYRKRVYSSEKKTSRKIELNLLNLSTALDEFINDYLLDVFHNQDKVFSLDARNEQTIKDLVSYFTRQQDSTLNIKKGICLYGGVGTGKSTIMKQLSKFTKDKELPTAFDFVYMDDVYTDCDSQGLESLNQYRFKACAFDDIGMRAENNVNNYGTKINAYKELVRRQYNRYSRPIPSLSHYTTNIEYNNTDYLKDLVKVFGGRELDRFREMCNFVELGGKSRRN